MSRGNQILTGFLVLQIALAAVILWPQAAPVAEGEPLFGPLEVDQVVQVTIRDQAGEQIRLLKDLGTWVLPNAGNYPCKEDAVPDLLNKLVELTADRLVTETRSSHRRLKVAVDDFESRVEFELSDGTRHVLYIGTAPSYGVAHVRVEGQDQVYLVSDLSSMDASTGAANWIDTQYVTLPQDEIFALTLQNTNGRFVFAKDSTTGTWSMPELGVGETLKESAVTSIASRVATVRMLRPLGTEEQELYGLAVPGTVLTVRTRDAGGVTQTRTFAIGAKLVGENAYFCKWSDSPYYVLVASYTVQEWVEATRDGFLELPPTPTPQPAG